MISLRKINSVRLRTPKSTDAVLGPSFDTAKRYLFNIDGNRFTFKSPKHSPYSETSSSYSKKDDVLTESFRSIPSGIFAVDSWETASLFSRKWGFYFSKFGGVAGELGMHIGINRRKDTFEIKSGSFFQPRMFESVMSLYLTNQYGWHTVQDEACHRGPIDWVVNRSFQVPAASFDILGSNEMRAFVFPITDMHFVEVSFYYKGREENVRESMRALVDRIIESMSLELSAETQGLIEQVKQGSPGIELTECFAPLKWPVAKEDVEKHEGLERELLS